jgi:dihydrofolate reductase
MKLIVACDPSGGIGFQNRLPWSKIQGDLPRFKHLTQNKIIVMGRNTWNSLPKKPLPNRINMVVTSSPLSVEGVIVIHDIYDLTDDHWLIGGAQIINSSWDKINEVHLTTTHDHYTCDTYIDLLYLENNFDIVYGETFSDHTYQIWKRV